MEDVEEQILSYPQLSVEKQRDVEAYVEANPEWAPLLQDVRAIEALVRGVHSDVFPSEGFLTTYVVLKHFHSEELSDKIRGAFRRLERRMEDDPALRERAEAARRRLEEAEAVIDPVAQFEELTGHSLSDAAKPASAETSATQGAGPRAADREPARRRRSVVDALVELPLMLRAAGAAIAVLLGVYVVLFGISEVSQSPLDRMAAVNVSNQIVKNYTSTATRSAIPSADTMQVDQLYVDALSTLRDARTSTLGLFPSYNSKKLDRAERLLNQVLDQTEAGSFLALEAQFYLGKIDLATGKVDGARAKFRTVVKREGRMADEAREILETLDEEYPAGTSS